MSKIILDVGQCDADNFRIKQLLTTHFDVEVERAHSQDEALAMAKDRQYDLVLINRILDRGGQEGMEVLSALKSDEQTRETPVMIVSNFEQAQIDAVAAGAEQGFGKAELNEPQTVERLQRVLVSETPSR